nr:hypothetical protein [Eisenbergiella porci]
MLPVNSGGHTAYQDFLLVNLRKHYPVPDSISPSTWDIIDRFWNLDLSFTDEFMRDKYSVFGPKPRTPSCMQRSFLLSIDFKVSSLTDWAAQLKINPLYAILSGFEFGDTPGVGTFYDFLNRLWDSDSDNLSPHIHPLKAKVKKPKTKGSKAAPVEKVSVEQLLPELENTVFCIEHQPYGSLFQLYKSEFLDQSVSKGLKGSKAAPVEKVSVEQLLPELENTVFCIEHQPYGSLFQLYKSEFLDQSVSKGLITPDSLALAGDGTPVVTSHRERKHRICDCASKGIMDCKCDRCFSQPDCDIGWDSSRDCWYHGYDLYMLVASDSESDLPVFPLLSPASTHDSHGFLHCFFRMKCFLSGYHVTKLLLDSAHDAMPYYEYCRRAHITPFIDLNEKRGIKLPYKNDFTIGKDGVPVCREGRRMNHDGSEPSKHRIKYRCSLASRKYGCSCEHPCSGSKYGRTVHVAMKDNPRLRQRWGTCVQGRQTHEP